MVGKKQSRKLEKNKMDSITLFLSIFIFIIISLMIIIPPLILFYLYFIDKNQKQHAVLRNYPILGRIRYILEQIGPELRQYMFNPDHAGKPFSRNDYTNIVISGKYLKTLISYGSKRDFEKPGWYIRNALFPTLAEDLETNIKPKISTKRYRIDHEGLFNRKESFESIEVSPWTLKDNNSFLIGDGEVKNPWRITGLMGMSAMSYGSLGENAISSISKGIGMATGSWINTGEGGLAPCHQVGESDIIMQIGPGLFGVRDINGDWSWDKFIEKANNPFVKGFELKFHQGAKIRGGHVEGSKVTESIAAIRGVEVGKNIDSPNRFKFLNDIPSLLNWINRMKKEGQKPVGIKLVMGSSDSPNELLEEIINSDIKPDWITVDGSEGGSGATYQEMADSMGLPIKSGIVILDNALRKYKLRNDIKIFASGKLFSPDKIAIALGLGADCINIARGLMISVGCIQALKCHTNECPVGVATTDKELQNALVVKEKQFRVLNYIITLRAGLNSLSAASGLTSPTEFQRKHIIYKDSRGQILSGDELFPYPK